MLYGLDLEMLGTVSQREHQCVLTLGPLVVVVVVELKLDTIELHIS